MTDVVPPADARTALAGLRPQLHAAGNPTRVADALIEPLWAGVRALAAIEDGVQLVDAAGDPIVDQPQILDELGQAALASSLIVDGVLTKLVARSTSGVYVAMDDLPSSGQLVSRPLLGIHRSRADEVTRSIEADLAARTFGPDDVITFVATDLLWLDGESLLDVPLLERRRLLDAVFAESERVRRGVFVRAPADAFIGSWRAQGFTGLVFKAANSRYHPGTTSPDWISMPMPRR